MAIEGLRTIPQPVEYASVSDDVGVSVEALDRLGLVEDRDQVTESITAEYNALNESGRTGEKYVQLPRGLVTLHGLMETSDNGVYSGDRKYPESFIYEKLWTPGADRGGYKATELDKLTPGEKDSNWPAHARLAVHNPNNPEEPLLHYLNKPFDQVHAADGEQTQLQAIAEATEAFEAEGHEAFAMTPLNAKAVAFIALMRRIKGEKMPMAWGYMRDATLRRKTVDGVSCVGDVNSSGDQLRLYGSYGNANSDVGVGLSVGPEVFEPQAS